MMDQDQQMSELPIVLLSMKVELLILGQGGLILQMVWKCAIVFSLRVTAIWVEFTIALLLRGTWMRRIFMILITISTMIQTEPIPFTMQILSPLTTGSSINRMVVALELPPIHPTKSVTVLRTILILLTALLLEIAILNWLLFHPPLMLLHT